LERDKKGSFYLTGLEYLHKGCNPPLIHRDVKATNILLNEKLEAKIADFGLSRAFDHDSDTHVSTNTLVGTPGYVDPEYVYRPAHLLSGGFWGVVHTANDACCWWACRYQATMQPTTKSDVYSFGVVLLELITGKPAILRDPEPTSIIQWVRKHLAQGDIEGVVDSRMPSDHDINGVWKVADVALKCAAFASVQRPTMTDVVVQLQECLQLEKDLTSGDATESLGYSNAADVVDLSAEMSHKSGGFAVEHNFGMVAATFSTGPGPATR
jgi:serine/threonine protein kinase